MHQTLQTPGYGTGYGTNFAGGAGQWKPKKSGVSKKMLGLGVGAGFLGGAALGVAGTMATYSVYHKYQEFKRQMHMMNPAYQGYNQNYYQNNYQQNECQFGCPMNAHCEWGFCECNSGTSRSLLALPAFPGGSASARLTGTHTLHLLLTTHRAHLASIPSR